jgi:hypothetical protein
MAAAGHRTDGLNVVAWSLSEATPSEVRAQGHETSMQEAKIRIPVEIPGSLSTRSTLESHNERRLQ